MSVRRKLRTFTNLPKGEKWMFVEAGVRLTMARLMVNLVPLSYWRSEIAVTGGERVNDGSLSAEERETSIAVRHAVKRVTRNIPVEFVCLPQALTARKMLARRGIATRLFIGTKRAAETDREFHAWLKAGKLMVTGDCDESDYVVFGTQARD